MVLLTKEGKLFGKISIIDIAVVLVLLAVAYGAYLRFFKPEEKVVTESQRFEYTVEVQDVNRGTLEALLTKGTVTNTSTKEYAGDIFAVSYYDYKESAVLPNGTVRELTVPERYTAEVRILVDGNVSETGYYTPTNQPISIGSTLNFSTKYVATSGMVTKVREID
ncbi:MAG: DUF4330 domain-containing protein [Ruminococcaceae bacterium]|nr:DUF4330 domain-containing protein [Oscillospiraceae bacterium]